MTREEYLTGKLSFAYCCYGRFVAGNLTHLIRLEFQNAPEEDLLFLGAFLKFENLAIQK